MRHREDDSGVSRTPEVLTKRCEVESRRLSSRWRSRGHYQLPDSWCEDGDGWCLDEVSGRAAPSWMTFCWSERFLRQCCCWKGSRMMVTLCFVTTSISLVSPVFSRGSASSAETRPASREHQRTSWWWTMAWRVNAGTDSGNVMLWWVIYTHWLVTHSHSPDTHLTRLWCGAFLQLSAGTWSIIHKIITLWVTCHANSLLKHFLLLHYCQVKMARSANLKIWEINLLSSSIHQNSWSIVSCC